MPEPTIPAEGSQRERPVKMWPQYLAALAATMGGFVMGTVIGWTGPALSKLVN